MNKDLDWLLDPSVKRDPSPPKAKKSSEPTVEDLSALVEALSSLWTPEAVIDILFQTHCSCGRVQLYPEVYPQGLPQKVLVRFRHQRTGQVWEKRVEAGSIPYHLPRVSRVILAVSAICPGCLDEAPVCEVYSLQLPLAL